MYMSMQNKIVIFHATNTFLNKFITLIRFGHFILPPSLTTHRATCRAPINQIKTGSGKNVYQGVATAARTFVNLSVAVRATRWPVACGRWCRASYAPSVRRPRSPRPQPRRHFCRTHPRPHTRTSGQLLGDISNLCLRWRVGSRHGMVHVSISFLL